jgi:hypothetical protein
MPNSNKGVQMKNRKEIQLVNLEGAIHIRVFAGIDEKGNLYLYGYDTGNLPLSDIYDDDVEYRLDVPSDQLEKVQHLIEKLLAEQASLHAEPNRFRDDTRVGLIQLISACYRDKITAFDDFKKLLEKNQIVHTFYWG